MATRVYGVHRKATGAFNASFSPRDVADYYSRWAPSYDQELDDKTVCKAPDSAAEQMSEVYTEDRDRVRILDVAAGTGLVGEKLYSYGFRAIDGLDPSEGMLKVCKSKNLYKNLICEFMTDNVPQVKTDSYDCIVSSGGMGDGHIPRNALKEMVRIVKPGGYICIGMREEFLTLSDEYNDGKLEDLMLEMEKAGMWRKVVRKNIEYLRHAVGVLYLYQVV